MRKIQKARSYVFWGNLALSVWYNRLIDSYLPRCMTFRLFQNAPMLSGGILRVSVRYRYSLSVVDGDGEDRDGRAGHGVVAYAGDRVAGRGETAVA